MIPIDRAEVLTPRRRMIKYRAGQRAGDCETLRMVGLRITVLFFFAAAAEIGGAWLIWHAVRGSKPWWWAAVGVFVLGAYGFIASFQPDASFARVLAAYGGVFIAGSIAWGAIFDKFRPTMWDYVGAAVALVGAAIIIFAPLVTRGRP